MDDHAAKGAFSYFRSGLLTNRKSQRHKAIVNEEAIHGNHTVGTEPPAAARVGELAQKQQGKPFDTSILDGCRQGVDMQA